MSENEALGRCLSNTNTILLSTLATLKISLSTQTKNKCNLCAIQTNYIIEMPLIFAIQYVDSPENVVLIGNGKWPSLFPAFGIKKGNENSISMFLD